MNKFTKVLSFSIVLFGFIYTGFYIASLQAPQRKAKEAIFAYLQSKASPLAQEKNSIFVQIHKQEQVSLPRLDLVTVTSKAGKTEELHCAVIGPKGAMCEEEKLLNFVITEYHLNEIPYLLSDPDWLKLVPFLLHVNLIRNKAELPVQLHAPKELEDQISLPEIKRQVGGQMTLSFYFLDQSKTTSQIELGRIELSFAKDQPVQVHKRMIFSN